MSSFISRGAVLASARLLNQALALLSPLLLVRLLDIVEYGRYRQFMSVAMLVTSIGGFYAFKRGSAEFKHLEKEVRRCTGRGIDRFQSEYAGHRFVIGD